MKGSDFSNYLITVSKD